MFYARAALATNGAAEFKRAEKPTVIVLEAGVVGSLDYKIIEASRADDLYQWLKDNKYSFSGDEASTPSLRTTRLDC